MRIFFLFILILLGLCPPGVYAVEEATLFEQFEKVWHLKPSTMEWTVYEKTAFQNLTGQLPNEPRMQRLPSEPGRRTLRVTYFDKFKSNGLGEIFIHLDEKAPPASIGITSDTASLNLTLNGVVFRPREQSAVAREVFLGDLTDPGEIGDRLRLSVNDNEILNPWHRQKVSELSREWGDRTELYPTPPQQAQLDFLKETYESGSLPRGALVQMPTGMGKTEVLEFFMKYLHGRKVPFRLLWLVRGVDLLDQSQERLAAPLKAMGIESLSWHSGTVKTRDEERVISQGAVDGLFVSMDSLAEANGANRNILNRWMEQDGKADVLVIIDEGQQMGAEDYTNLYEWLWQEHQGRILGRVGASATPVHHQAGDVLRYFGHRVHYALIQPDEIDSVTGLPRVSFLQQLIRSAKRGYNAIPLLYALDREALDTQNDNKYRPEQMEDVWNTLRTFEPYKGILFHPRGQSAEFGATSRMRQFTKFAKANTSDFPVFAMSTHDDSDTRSQALTNFRNSKHGQLNLTRIGALGMDIRDTNLIGLLDSSKSAVLTSQRIGRGTRLSPGAGFVRILDWTGDGLRNLFIDMASLALGKSMAQHRRAIRKVLESVPQTGEISERTRNDVYEVLGIDPALISADNKVFREICRDVRETLRLANWRVRPPEQQTHSDKLPESDPEESLAEYLRREDVHQVLAGRLGQSTLDIKRVRYRTVSKVLLADLELPGFGIEKLDSMVGSQWIKLRKEAGHVASHPARFSVRPGEQQQSPFKLPPSLPGEFLVRYLVRPEVMEVIAARLGGPVSEAQRASYLPVMQSIFPDLLFPELPQALPADKFSAIWTKARIRLNQDAPLHLRRDRMNFEIRAPFEQKHTLKLPARHERDTLSAYFKRDDVRKILRGRAGRSEQDPTDISQSYLDRILQGDILTLNRTASEASPWLIKLLRDAFGIESEKRSAVRTKRLDFSVKLPEAQLSPHKLPARRVGEGLQTYLKRPDVMAVIAARAEIPLDQLLPLPAGGVIPKIIPDIEFRGLSPEAGDLKIYGAWYYLQKGVRGAKSGLPRPNGRLRFLVRSAADQTHLIKLPPAAVPIEKYLAQKDVQGVIGARLNRAAAPVTDIRVDDVILALGDDITQSSEMRKRIRNGWRAIQREVSGEAKKRMVRRDFSVRDASVQISPHKLPPSATPKIGAYLSQPAVRAIVEARAGQPWAELSPTVVGRLLAPDIQLGTESLTTIQKKVGEGWSYATREFRESRVQRSQHHFSVRPAAEQVSEFKFPPPKVGQSLRAYLMRPDVIETFSFRLDLQDPVSVPLKRLIEAMASDIALPERPSTEKAQQFPAEYFMTLHGGSLATKRRGGKGRKGVPFHVLSPDKQSSPHKLPPNETNGVSNYLAQPAVQSILRLRLGLSETAKLLPRHMSKAIGADIVSDSAQPIDFAKFASVVKVRLQKQNLKKSWPQSHSLQKELPRVLLIHQAVGTHLVERLAKEPNAEVYFIGRDADDFLAVTKNLLKNSGIDESRVHRLLLSRPLIAGNPTNPSEISALSEAELRTILAEQKLSADKIKSGMRPILFDIGFDGHVMRPVLASLLKESGLEPEEFHRRVTPLFLGSRPEQAVKGVELPSEDGLEYLTDRQDKLRQNVSEQWTEFAKEFSKSPTEAIAKYLRAYGTMRIEEFPLGEALEALATSGKRDRSEILSLMQSKALPLLKDPVAWRDWLESFVEGKGQQIVENAEEHAAIRQDLARGTGRVRAFENGQPKFEQNNPKESAVDPASEIRRHQELCKQISALRD